MNLLKHELVEKKFNYYCRNVYFADLINYTFANYHKYIKVYGCRETN